MKRKESADVLEKNIYTHKKKKKQRGKENKRMKQSTLVK